MAAKSKPEYKEKIDSFGSSKKSEKHEIGVTSIVYNSIIPPNTMRHTLEEEKLTTIAAENTKKRTTQLWMRNTFLKRKANLELSSLQV